MSETYDNKAVNGKELAEHTLVDVASEIKREGYVSAAAFNDVVARLVALEKAVAESNIGDRIADSLDSQSLKVGGTDVKTRQAAKTNPSSIGSDISFVDSIAQNENGEITATRKSVRSASTSQTGVVQLTDSHSSNSTSTAATPKNVKEAYDLAAAKVDSTDSRLLPNADVFVATYTEQAAGTTMEELAAARTAGKKIYVNIGGSMSGESNIYEKMIPLTYVRYYNGEVTGYFFETVIDSLVKASDAGKITTYWRAANGWGQTTSEVKYAETAGIANEATNAKGYVEGEAIAQGLASKMSTTADNAAAGALQNLCGQISTNFLTDLVDGSDIITSYPGPDGMSTQGHVNQLYASKALRVYNYIKSKLVSQKDVATPPRLALLDSPKYYWRKPNGDVVTSYVRVVDATKSSSSYYNLGNEVNTSTRWGVCHVPNFGTLAGTYVEIDFDIALSSYYIDSGWLIGNPYANLDLPYIMKFVAATKSNDGDAVISIPTSSNTIFASFSGSIDCMRGDTKSFGHVHMSGRIGASSASNEAIFICALGYYGMDNVAVLAEMGNVRVKATNDDKGMT